MLYTIRSRGRTIGGPFWKPVCEVFIQNPLKSLFFLNCKSRPPELKHVDLRGSEGGFLDPFYGSLKRLFRTAVYGQVVLSRGYFITFSKMMVLRHTQSKRGHTGSWRHHLPKSQKCDFFDSRSIAFPDWTRKSSPQFSYSPNHYCDNTVNNLRSLFTKRTPQIVYTPNYCCGNTVRKPRGTFRLWAHQPRDPHVILMCEQSSSSRSRTRSRAEHGRAKRRRGRTGGQ